MAVDFIVSIALSILAFFLIKHTPETKVEPSVDETKTKFDVTGLILLVITLLSVNVMVTQAAIEDCSRQRSYHLVLYS